MKKSFLFALVFIFSVTLFAQEEEFETSSRFGKSDRLMVDWYTDMWLGAPDSAEIRSYCPGASVSLMQDFALGSSNFSFAVGLGIGTHNLHSNSYIIKETNTDYMVFQKYVDEPKKNKLVLSYVDLPLEIRFRTKRQNVFRLAVGGKFGYNINNHIKYEDDYVKRKHYNVDYINPLRYGVTARVGYKMYNLYVYYGLSTLFETNKGTEMAPLSIGISFIPF
ncbi:MAG: PorT family protein [Bacteroidales bacterium]|nr:PorT family protein [Bacteroidales bacterium]